MVQLRSRSGDLKGAFATDYEIALVWNRKAQLSDKRIEVLGV